MKKILSLAISLAFFQFATFAQSNTVAFSNYSSTALTSPSSFLSTSSTLQQNSSNKGFFNFYVGGFGVRTEAKNWGYGGQVDAMLNFGKKVSIGAMGNVQMIDEQTYTPVVGYARLNLTKMIGIQGGYGWYMNDFKYNFADANNGYYGAVVLGGNRVNLEIGGYFPDNEDYRITVGLKARLFKF
jgi:hypothetical protein